MAIAAALARAERHSPFLARLIAHESDLVAAMLDDAWPAPESLRIDDAAMPVGRRLRIERRRLALLVAIGDLAGLTSFEAVTRALSDFADYALGAAIESAIEERSPGAGTTGFVALALGKQGSRELNYSSDIDPILLYDPGTLPRRAREAPEEAAARIARRAVELLQTPDGDGYVLRVDLRLRPSPEATSIALPIDAALSYYESQALVWERAAFIRARAAAGDLALGQRFLEAIRPFVWRRTLDFGAIGEIRAISRRIRDHHAQGQAFGPGYDVKRGRGGIREVEFFAQIHQLIHGGRDPALRVPATLDALQALAAAGRIDAGEAAALGDAYRLYRTTEHRIQMIDDRQTHSLPARPEALDGVARLHGVDNGAALLALLRPDVERVGTIYDSLDAGAESEVPCNAVQLGETLAAAGVPDTAAAAARIAAWRSGTMPALRSPAARTALEAVLPGLIAALGEAPDPNAAFNRLDTVLARLPSAINFFRLLQARPALARLLGAVLSHAPTLADALGTRIELLDGLIDATALDAVGSLPALVAEMSAIEAGDDYQRLLDHVRRVVGERRFALGVQIVAGTADPLDVAAGYARVAEAAIGGVAAATIVEFAGAHGRVPASELVVLALGRLGGRALTHASDLDLIYLFTGDHAAESDGGKPLGAVHYYNRLAQRVSAALSVPTAAGRLYDIDTRLRPSGAQGPLAVSVAGFERYQQEEAWTWEHMALTRARAVFGSKAAREAVEAIIAAALSTARPGRDAVADAVAMRTDIARHKPPIGPLDAKLLPGGLVDLEFAVHAVQLRERTGFAPELPVAIALLVAAGQLPASLVGAHDLLTRLLVTLRLVAPDAAVPAPATRAVIARACGVADWESLVASFERTRQDVATIWRDVGGENGDR